MPSLDWNSHCFISGVVHPRSFGITRLSICDQFIRASTFPSVSPATGQVYVAMVSWSTYAQPSRSSFKGQTDNHLQRPVPPHLLRTPPSPQGPGLLPLPAGALQHLPTPSIPTRQSRTKHPLRRIHRLPRLNPPLLLPAQHLPPDPIAPANPDQRPLHPPQRPASTHPRRA